MFSFNRLGNEASLENETMINLGEIMPINFPDRMTNFFRYAGSLTTPGCFETVQWTVFRDPLFITTSQVIFCILNSSVKRQSVPSDNSSQATIRPKRQFVPSDNSSQATIRPKRQFVPSDNSSQATIRPKRQFVPF